MGEDRVWWYDSLGCEETDDECLARWKVLHIAAIVPGYMSICATVFIIVTAIEYRELLAKLSFGAQIPMCVCLSTSFLFCRDHSDFAVQIHRHHRLGI